MIRRTALLTSALAALPFHVPAQSAPMLPEGFDARAVVALADGAMLASGYVDGRLGPRTPDLAVVLAPDGARAELAVSNSVATWPNTLALSPDGRFAVVAEPFAQPPEDAETFDAIERGRRLTVIDLADPAAPRVVQEIDAPSAPVAVDVHPDGDLVAVTLPFEGRIALYPFAGGRLGEPVVQDLGVDDLASPFVPEIAWRPDGRFAAVTLGAADRVVFYRFDDGRLTPWGEPMRTAPLPGMGRWTPDGRLFVVTTITATADMAQAGYGQNASLLAVFAFDDTAEPDSPPRRADDRQTGYESPAIQHARLAHVPAGLGYVETIALSPDGRFLAAANMRASWLPADHPGRSEGSELSLFALDAETGALDPVATRALPDVILPQGLAFDADGSHLALTSFQHDDREGGSLRVFALSDGVDGPTLSPAGVTVPLPRGAHFLAVLP